MRYTKIFPAMVMSIVLVSEVVPFFLPPNHTPSKLRGRHHHVKEPHDVKEPLWFKLRHQTTFRNSKGILNVKALKVHCTDSMRRMRSHRIVMKPILDSLIYKDASQDTSEILIRRQTPGAELEVPGSGNFWTTTLKVGDASMNVIIDSGSGLTIVDGDKYRPGAKSIDMKHTYDISFNDASSSHGKVRKRNSILIYLRILRYTETH